MKLENFPAAVRTGPETLQASRTADLPDASFLQVSEVAEFVSEHRFFVRDGEVLTGSPYLLEGRTWYPGMEDETGSRHEDALAYAREAVSDLSARGLLPPGVVVDVGMLQDGRWCVVEANPVWSSALYGSDPELVLFALEGGIDHAGVSTEWLWDPDPFLMAKALRARPLPRR